MRPIIPVENRFWAKVKKGSSEECWMWTASTNGVYGKLGVGRAKDGLIYAHRFSWSLVNGPIPEGLMIDHKCRNKLCVNPNHLQLVTPWGNQHYSTDSTSAAKTHCCRGHNLKKARVIKRKNGYTQRVCEVCAKQRAAQYGYEKFGRIKGVHRSQKLSAKSAAKIKRLYQTGQFNQREIGERFGVSNQTVSNVIRGQTKYQKYACSTLP